MTSFKLVSSVTGDGDLVVRKYRSPLTGLSAVIAKVDGPVVNGYLVIATEAHDDDGIPHTLEHLVFMGSDDYPYKGVLDLLANRCLASGTNAWTDTDHTCYTMTTAGSDGFLNLLPVYLDHVLYPTLKDTAFVTEVHHVNEDGEDAGVVYCEMQGRENSGESRCHLEMLRAMYPGNSGYKSETGGLMKNLRESTTNDKIKKYHAEVYRPENLCVVVTGQVNDDEIINCLAKFEQKILDYRKKNEPAPWARPWQDPVEPLPATVEKVVEYPCDDDNNGLVYVAWRGPSCTKDFETTIALSLLLEYLDDTAAAPLQQEFVECDDPFCSSVGGGFIENSESCFYLSFESVPKEKLELVKDKLFEVLREILNGTKPFDEKRMASIIHRKKLQLLSTMESAPHFAIASSIIGDFLYGSTDEDLVVRLKQVPVVEKFGEKKADYWLGLLEKYCINSKHVAVTGKPSPVLMEQMSADEKKRIEEQRSLLAEEGLKEKAKLLDSSKAANEILPPSELITKLPIPSTAALNFHELTRLTNAPDSLSNTDVLGFKNITSVPFRMQVDNLKTNFVTLRALLNTPAAITPELRIYLPLWCELITESSIKRGDTIVPYEEIVSELASDTISSGAEISVGGQFSQVVVLALKMEVGKYSNGIAWLRELLYETIFTEQRVITVVKRMLNDLAMVKRKGNKVADDLIRSMDFDTQSNFWAIGAFRQINFLNKLQQRLTSNPQSVLEDLNKLRDHITALENLTVHISLNAKNVCEELNIQDLVTPWTDSFLPPKLRQNLNKGQVTNKVTLDYNLVLKQQSGVSSGSIAGVGSVESNFMQQSVESIKSFTDPDLAPFLVLIQYLTQLEGPMWRQIRGMGLSYHYNISLKVSEGLVYFILFKSTHLVNAYKEAIKIVDRHISGEEKWDETSFEASKSSLVFELIEREKSVPRVSVESIKNYLRGVDMGYTKYLVQRVMQVTIDDVKRVAPLYLTPLFDATKSRCGICCHPSKVKEVVEGFKELNKHLEVVNLEDNTAFVSKL